MGRVIYIPPSEAIWAEYFLNQAIQTGHGMDGFQGFQYQRGHGLGSFFGGLLRSILPVARSVGKSMLKSVGKQALAMGASVAGDMARGRGAKEALEEHGRNAVANVADEASTALRQPHSQSGHGIGKADFKPTPYLAKKRRQKRNSKKTKRRKFDIFQVD